MKAMIKRMLRVGLSRVGEGRIGRFVFSEIVDRAMRRAVAVEHDGTRLTFAAPNALNEFRVASFSRKEPETLAWIDRMPPGSTLWDIGANIGLYSCYAARRRNCRVYAFEPSVFNLELLARNIALNDLADRVTIVPLPICDGLAESKLNMTSTEWGGALSTYGSDIGFDGKPMKKVFEFATIGLSLDEAATLLGLPQPDYVKIDVDGIEHLVLKGGRDTLRKTREVLVEINDSFAEQVESATRYLMDAGLRLVEKRRWTEASCGPHENTFNQIWTRADGL